MVELLNGLPGPVTVAIYFLIALFPLVLIHELGHFVVAKWNKVRVDEFGIGFPPRVAKLHNDGETEYTLNILPLGGFVRLAGEDDPTVPGAFASRSKKARAAVLFAGPLANFLLAAVIFGFTAAAGLVPEPAPEILGVSVARVMEGLPAAQAGLQGGDIIVAVDGRPLAELAPSGELQAGETRISRSFVDAVSGSAGTPMRLTLLRNLQRVRIEQPLEGAQTEAVAMAGLTGARRALAASSRGLQPGDLIVQPPPAGAVDDPTLIVPDEPTVLRGVQVVELAVTPVKPEGDDKARMGIEIGIPSVSARLRLAEAPLYGVQTMLRSIQQMVMGLVAIVIGQLPLDVGGPVRIAVISRDMGERGPSFLLTFIALLSINLGVINLLPIPALDGGRLLFIAVEAIRGQRVEPAREAVVHLIGFALVVGLMAVLTAYEIYRLIGTGQP
jgi:regulator of sigma E protease